MDSVRIVEVGPRDGLQNEPVTLNIDVKVNLIEALANTGIRHIEAGSFVSPKWVPQMASSSEVFARLKRLDKTRYAALVPNETGMQAALNARVDEVAVFTAASESFVQKNINCSISESLERFKPVIRTAIDNGVPVRGYVSCIAGCPYEGEISTGQVAEVTSKLLEAGCYEVSLGDTIGKGTTRKIRKLVATLLSQFNTNQLAVHFHDTYGQALANIAVALEEGVRVIDSSVAGLGGCPYAPGAAGNVATEDVVYLCEGNGLHTGIDLEALSRVGDSISQTLQRRNQSKTGQAYIARR